MEIGTADRRTELKLRSQSRVDAAQSVNMVTQAIDHSERVLLLVAATEGEALSKPPRCRPLVVAVAVNLIDRQRASRSEERREMRARFLQRIDMVQRDHRDSRVELPVDLDQRERLHMAVWLCRWVDRGHLVARCA
jgi:adenylate cyclase